MKKLLTVVLIIISLSTYAQTVISDSNFEEVINGRSAFEDDGNTLVVIEFYAEFNKDNAFKDWAKVDKLDGVKYYRCDISNSPQLKKDLKIRMAPTILLYIRGDAYIKFTAKAGLDLKCPVDYDKLVRAIEVVKIESQY